MTKIEDEIKEIIKNNHNGYDDVVLLRTDIIDICGGDINSAIILAQLIFWAERGAEKNDGWIFKSATDWYNEARLSEQNVKTAKKNLKELGFIETEIKMARGKPTTFYKINEERIKNALSEIKEQKEII